MDNYIGIDIHNPKFQFWGVTVLNMCTQHSWATTGSHPNWAGCN